MQHTAYRLGEYTIIEYEHGDLWWETHIGLRSSKSGKCFINGDILFIKPSGSMGPGFLKAEFLDHLQFQMNLLEVLFNMDNTQYIKVWDIAIRAFHWTLVGCYAIAFISSENIPRLHVFFGYSVLFLVLFRILYGFVGTKYARFSDFLYQPAQIVNYLKGLLIRRPKHYIGHNPAGGFMIIILLLSLLSLTLTGLKAYGVKGHGLLAKHEVSFMMNAFADSDDKKNNDEHASRKPLSQKNHRTEKNKKDEFWEEVHETIAHFTLFLMSIHILGVLVSSLLHRENLIKAMITGRKRLV